MMQRKPSSLFIAACCVIFALHPVKAFAADEDSGELRLQIERIGEEEKGRGSVETELDKRFPELFDRDTGKKISDQQTRSKDSMQAFKQALFEKNNQLDKVKNEMTEQLFTADYTEPEMETGSAHQGVHSITLMLVLVLVGGALLAGLFWTFRKLA